MPIQQFHFEIPIPLLVLLVSLLPILVFYIGRAVYIHWQRMDRLNSSLGCVPATVTQISLDVTSWREGWVVIAAWVDAQTRQTYLFQSSPQELRPQKRVGEHVLVFIASNHPMQYSMEL